jgi:DNA-binding response OmpR family regulator
LPDDVDVAPRLLVIVVGDVRGLPAAAFAGLTAVGAAVVSFATPDAAREWLANLRSPTRFLRIGPLEIDRDLRTASWAGAALALTEQELDLVLALAEAPGRTLAFRELDRRVWGDRHRRDTQRIRSAVKRLRRKLAAAGVRCTVQAVRGFGLRLVVERPDPSIPSPP